MMVITQRMYNDYVDKEKYINTSGHLGCSLNKLLYTDREFQFEIDYEIFMKVEIVLINYLIFFFKQRIWIHSV